MYEYAPTHYYQPYYYQPVPQFNVTDRWFCSNCAGWVAWWVTVHHCASGYTTNKVKITSDN